MQIGEGNDAREIRVEGWNAKGEKGYFYKMVNELEWQFKPLDSISGEDPLDLEIKDENGELQTTVFDFASDKIQFNALKKDQQPQKVMLKDFGIGNSNSPLVISVDGIDYKFNLHRKKTFKNFLGIEGDHYDLIIPKDLHDNEIVHKLFRGKKSMGVSVQTKENPRQLILKTSLFNITLTPQE